MRRWRYVDPVQCGGVNGNVSPYKIGQPTDFQFVFFLLQTSFNPRPPDRIQFYGQFHFGTKNALESGETIRFWVLHSAATSFLKNASEHDLKCRGMPCMLYDAAVPLCMCACMRNQRIWNRPSFISVDRQRHSCMSSERGRRPNSSVECVCCAAQCY